jgi:predicted phage terminase large subunit-like protein
MGSFYRSQHELIFVWKNGRGKHINNIELGRHGRNRSNVWAYGGANAFSPDRLDDLAMHPTVKPVAMVADAVRDCSRRGDIVLDSFGGSGTALIACERREKDTQTETMTTARGHRLATSLGGTLTGRGADLVVMDDPQKPEEALSVASRNHAGQWFDTTLLSRLDSKTDGAVILVMQRLHEDDLAGRLLEKGGWHYLKIPAIAQQDEPVQVGPRRTIRRKSNTVIDARREPLEALDNLRKSMGALHFSAQYQQEPIPLEGNLIKLEWFREYEVAPTYTYSDKLVISIDTAMKGDQLADFSVATVWLARGEHSFLIDLWRERVDYPNLKHAVTRLRLKYPHASLLIEDKGSGTSLIQELRANNIAVIPITPEGDKITRCAAVSAQFESGCVFFPKNAPWLDELKAELLGFPNTRNDDQIDSITQALIWTQKRRQQEVPIVVPIIVPGRLRFPPNF